jgi:hypothetical protein
MRGAWACQDCLIFFFSFSFTLPSPVLPPVSALPRAASTLRESTHFYTPPSPSGGKRWQGEKRAARCGSILVDLVISRAFPSEKPPSSPIETALGSLEETRQQSRGQTRPGSLRQPRGPFLGSPGELPRIPDSLTAGGHAVAVRL